MRQNALAAAEHSLLILEQVERDPDVTQADLASRLGVAVGSVNWYLKRLVAKGYIKVAQLQRRRLRYLITPQGIAEKTRLALSYMEVSLRTYRELREESRRLIGEARARGFSSILVDGDGDAGEIVRLTCMEMGMHVAGSGEFRQWPAVVTTGTRLSLTWPLTAVPGAEGHTVFVEPCRSAPRGGRLLLEQEAGRP